jgi:hypothetical protein
MTWRFLPVLALLLLTPSCKKKEPPVKKVTRAAQLKAAAAEREAVLRFADNLRGLISTRSSAADALVQMKAISTEGLPSNLIEPWTQVIQATSAITQGSPKPEQLTAAAAAMNTALAAHGLLDVRL